jgi:hypothetical protein
MTVVSSHYLEDQLARQLQAAHVRITARYRSREGITEEQIRDAFDRAITHFADAQVRNFIPILVERIVEVELERQSLGHSNHAYVGL